jgi:hypothetical protein
MGGPLDSLYNAEYQRLATTCRGAGDACYLRELDSTAVRLAPVWSSPGASQPVGWLATRLRARGAYPYAGLLFVGADGREVPLAEDLGDWGYGATLDLLEFRTGWLRPWLLQPAGDYWLQTDGGPGFGVVEGPYGLEGRLWRLEPAGTFMVLSVEAGVVRRRPELPFDMACGEPVDSAAYPAVPVQSVPLAELLDPAGRPRVEVADPRGC